MAGRAPHLYMRVRRRMAAVSTAAPMPRPTWASTGKADGSDSASYWTGPRASRRLPICTWGWAGLLSTCLHCSACHPPLHQGPNLTTNCGRVLEPLAGCGARGGGSQYRWVSVSVFTRHSLSPMCTRTSSLLMPRLRPSPWETEQGPEPGRPGCACSPSTEMASRSPHLYVQDVARLQEGGPLLAEGGQPGVGVVQEILAPAGAGKVHVHIV